MVLTTVFYFILKALGSWGPLPDAWILTGSILATYGMARGWVEFWLVWIAVDLVGVPLLLIAQLYPSALMYIVYGAFCVIGFVSWLRIERRELAEHRLSGWPTGDRDRGSSRGLRRPQPPCRTFAEDARDRMRALGDVSGRQEVEAKVSGVARRGTQLVPR